MGLDPSHQLTDSDIHYYELPDEIGDNWRDLARALGYKEAKIRSIEKEKGNCNKECCIDLLVRWLHKKGRDATAGKLAEALAKIELKSLAEKLVKPNDPSQSEKTLDLWRENNLRMIARIKKAEEEGVKMSATIKELEEKNSINSVRIKELEEENSKLRGRIKELEDASQQEQKDLENPVQLLDTKNASVASMDTDQAARERRISERLKYLTKRLNTYVTPQLEVPEVNQDQLKRTVKLDLLRRLSENLQELYSDILAMVSETCKCNEDLKRDFYDFAYHGLRAEHNELVHRVEDLKSALHEMSEEEEGNLVQLQSYQVNRQRQVERLDKVWRGLFSPVSRHTDPGARPKQTKPRDQAPSVNCEADKNESTLNDLQDTAGVLRDTDPAARELRISERLKNLNQELNTYVTAPLEMPEVKQDQLKTPVKLDLLTRLSERLHELYSNIQAMVSETCKCSEDLKRDFYDFVYHGLRVEHNELVYRVKDLESTEPEMSEEEREDLKKLQKYQVNRQRYVERLDNVWRGLFSPPERLPKTPWSDTTGISDSSKKSKKLLRHTDPGARPKQTKPRDQAPSVNCEADKNEFTLNVTKWKTVKSIFRKKEKDKDACALDPCSKMRDS